MKRLLILILCSGLWACSENPKSSSGSFLGAPKNARNPANQDDGSLVTRDTTDRSLCHGATSAEKPLAGRTWKLNYSFSNGATVDQYISFQENFMLVENNCSWRNQTKTARVKVPIQMDVHQFEIQAGDSDQKIIHSENEEFYCVVDVPNDLVKFSFVGSCLSFDFPDRPIVLAPADYEL